MPTFPQGTILQSGRGGCHELAPPAKNLTRCRSLAVHAKWDTTHPMDEGAFSAVRELSQTRRLCRAASCAGLEVGQKRLALHLAAIAQLDGIVVRQIKDAKSVDQDSSPARRVVRIASAVHLDHGQKSWLPASVNSALPT